MNRPMRFEKSVSSGRFTCCLRGVREHERESSEPIYAGQFMDCAWGAKDPSIPIDIYTASGVWETSERLGRRGRPSVKATDGLPAETNKEQRGCEDTPLRVMLNN